ncbi:MAG TPA: hypothetical protein VGG01_14100 [Xanthobacteraceae bacterium]|jgi:hypothetical protein
MASRDRGSRIAGAASLIANLKTIKEALGINPTKLALQVGPGGASDDHVMLFLPVVVRKSGPDILRGCRYTIWLRGAQLDVFIPPRPLVFPAGQQPEQRTTVAAKYGEPLAYPGSAGTISLNCSSIGSATYDFRIE